MDESFRALNERLRRLEDLEAIRDTWRDYCFRLDSEDWSGLADVFTEDAALDMIGLDAIAPGSDGSFQGREAIVGDFYKPTLAGIEGALSGHLSTNMQITLDGDEATTLAYFFEIVGDAQVIIGTYQHRMRRDADRWRFAHLRISVRFRAKLAGEEIGGLRLQEVLERPF